MDYFQDIVLGTTQHDTKINRSTGSMPIHSLIIHVLSGPPDNDLNTIKVHPLIDNFLSGHVVLSCRTLLSLMGTNARHILG